MSISRGAIRDDERGGSMVFLSNVRIGPKILLGYGVLLLFMAAVAVLGYWGMGQIRTAEEFALKRQADATSLWEMRNYMVNQYAEQADLIINGDPQAVQAFREQVAAMDALKEEVRQVVDTEEERRWMEEIDDIDKTFDALFIEQIVPAVEAGDQELVVTLDDQSDALLDQMESVVEKMTTSFSREVAEAQDEAAATYRQVTVLMIGLAIVAAVIGMTFGYLLSRSISNPLRAVTRAALRLAEGDVQQQVGIRSGDEVGEMASAFRQMITYQQEMAEAADRLARGDLNVAVTPQSEKDVLGQAFRRMVAYQQSMADTASRLARGDLTAEVQAQSDVDVLGLAFARMMADLRNLIGEVQSSAVQVASASQQINAAAEQSAEATQQVAMTIQQIAQGTTQQTEGVTRTITIVDQVSRAIEGVARGAQEQAAAVARSAEITGEISSVIEQVAAGAEAGAARSSQTAQTARVGAQTIEQMVLGMQAIKDKVGQSVQKVQEMGQRSEEIGAIVETIDDIASQTNLLALNAAIEAARAGEHGKGFAVVADEVRKLAESSTQATKEIATLIKGIQRTVAEAVTAMNEGSAEVDAGVTRAGESGQALSNILASVETVNQQVDEIAAAAKRMSISADEMVAAMDAVSAVVEENTASTEEMAAGAAEVSGAIEEIASVSEENSASAEEVSAAVEEVSAQAEEVTASSQSLSSMAQDLQTLVSRFQLQSKEQLT